jgi:hypothetical protein
MHDLTTDVNTASGQDTLAQPSEPTTTEPEQPTLMAAWLPIIPETSPLNCLAWRYLMVIACSIPLLLLSLLAYAVGFPPPAETLLGRAAIFIIGHPVIIPWFLANQITSHFGHVVGWNNDTWSQVFVDNAAWNRVFWFAFTPYLATLLGASCLKAYARKWGEALIFFFLATNYWAVGDLICTTQLVA